MKFVAPKAGSVDRRMQTLATLLLLASGCQLAIRAANCQASDGDDQFQAYHGDIGRISGSAAGSQIAPQTTVVRQAPAAAAAAAAVTAPAAARPLAGHQFEARATNQQQGRQHQASPRKPNRITLAVRTHAPLSVVANGQSEPAPITSSLVQAQQIQHQHQTEAPLASPSFGLLGDSQLAPPPPLAQFAPSFQPANVAPLVEQPSNFQSSLSSSVSARHSALMAQVAAERQAQQQHQHQQQPSLGSPLEALSSPAAAVAQVQPPPSLQSQQLPAAASPAFTFVNQPEEPLVAPSFESVLSRGCPNKGVFSYENKDHCDRYYMCTNGTFTEEACPNGLAYSQLGAVYQHCAYNWNVNCGNKKTSGPLASPGCPWQFGIFPVSSAGQCSIDYFVCEWGVPETKRCSPEGLFYDDRIKGCQWADQLGCKSEALLNFKCPPEDEDNPYWPYPRYYHTKQDVIVCVNEQPRLVHCNEDQLVDPSSLACMDLKKKKKPKLQ